MATYFGNDRKTYTMDEELGKGSTGSVFSICGDNDNVAKIFHKPNTLRNKKIIAMYRLEWSTQVKEYVVLPKVILFEDEQLKTMCGFVMEKLDEHFVPLSTILRERRLSIRKLAVVGISLCEAVREIHSSGNGNVLIGDFNANDVWVNHITGAVKFVNMDSFQINCFLQGEKTVIPCVEIYPDLISPEIMKLFEQYSGVSLEQLHAMGLETFTRYTDYFCLAFHLHMLLLGCNPFSAKTLSVPFTDKSVEHLPISRHFLVKNGNYCYSNLPNNTALPDYCPDFDVITPELQKLFIRAFQDGARQAGLRPTPDEFIEALKPFVSSLNYCECNGWNHYLHDSWKKSYCEWCRIDKVLGVEDHIPSHVEDILHMTDRELCHVALKQETESNDRVYAYVLYEFLCRCYGKGHNGASEFSVSLEEKDVYLKTVEEYAKQCAPELMDALADLKI